MKDYSYEEMMKLDKFVSEFNTELKWLEHYAQYLKFPKEDQETFNMGMEILKSKLKKMKKSRSVQELKETVKIKKVLDRKEK